MYIIYGTSWCPWCDKAKELIPGEFIFKNIEENINLEAYKEHFPGKKTVPQIMLMNEQDLSSRYIGGYEDLVRWLRFTK